MPSTVSAHGDDPFCSRQAAIKLHGRASASDPLPTIVSVNGDGGPCTISVIHRRQLSCLSRARPLCPAQARTTSATNSLPRVSGLMDSASSKLINPPIVPIAIGIANPRCQSIAK
jgi:hypothetical protein